MTRTEMQTLVEGYQKRNYSKVKRGDDAYQETLDLTTSELKRLLDMYSMQFSENQTARLIRDSIDHWIRRYHDYCIQGRIGSHYREVGVDEKDSIFEHVIPASSVRDMLIEGRLSIVQALNTPTCLIKKSSDKVLSASGLGSTSPNNWFFFQRYSVLNSSFETYNGCPVININQHSLADHYQLFGIK